MKVNRPRFGMFETLLAILIIALSLLMIYFS